MKESAVWELNSPYQTVSLVMVSATQIDEGLAKMHKAKPGEICGFASNFYRFPNPEEYYGTKIRNRTDQGFSRHY
jgi:hypothetical protein